MRIVTIILATLLLLGAAGIGLLGSRRGIKDAKDIDSLYKPMQAQITAAAKTGDKSAKQLQDIGEKTGAMRAGAFAFALAALASLALLIMTYVHKKVNVGVGAVVVLAVAAVVINPHYELGASAPASARKLAYVFAALAVLGALCAFGAAAIKQRRLAA